jgi:molecular chaperone GrpE
VREAAEREAMSKRDMASEKDESKKPAEPAAAEPGITESVSAEIARLEGEAKALKERLLEALADRDNQAKRFGRERQVVRDEITARMAREMIEVLDNLDLVLQALPESERETPLAKGVELTRVVFLEKLRAFGVEPIEPLLKPFNPFHHESVFEEERGDVAPGTVVGEITRGYRMGGQLVRAAKVRVAKAKTAPSKEAAAGDATPPAED